MAVFAHVVELRSFSKTAGALGLSKSAVSKQIAEIERSLGVSLLQRSTRRVRVTEAGKAYYQSCARVVAEADAAEQAVGDLHRKPVGTLRINAPIEFGTKVVTPALADYLQKYRDVRAELTLQDDVIDIISTGTDVAIRIGRLPDSSLIARMIAPLDVVLVASPEYLARRGTPSHPRELTSHDFLLYALAQNPRRLTLYRAKRRYAVTVDGPLISNNGGAHRAAAIAGLGIAHLPDIYVHGELAAGTLVPLLTDYTGRRTAVHAVYAPGSTTTKQRLFIDHLLETMMRNCPAHRSPNAAAS